MTGLPKISRRRPPYRRARRRGAMVVLVLIIMVALLATAAFSVDLAYMQLTRTKLRAATDAAARAGAEAINRTQDVEIARRTVKRVAAENSVAGQALTIKDEDVVFGKTRKGNDGRWHFVANEQPYNSARVLGDRTRDSEDGSVQLAFGRALGRMDFEASMNTTAAKVGVPKRDFVIVADRSHSMAFDLSGRDWVYPDGHHGGYCGRPHPSHSRWAHLVQAVGKFIDGLKDTDDEERLGLVTYASRYYGCGGYYPAASIDVQVTENHSRVGSFLDARSQDAIPGGTNIYAGIVEGIRAISDSGRTREDAKKVIVLMTDGRHNTGSDPIHAAEDAKREGIMIITITFSDGADQQRMKRIANRTGGQHFHAPTAADLKKIFRQVADGTIGLVFVE